ncbi:tryptophan--tRNA ligase [Anoxynatronum buryatiense]|uniref:Tryptophan--tRNA ligase n=1 Tax=Anoxynatronum buryatiense TaxID=489973 RepID=A0AA45WWR2_9CLOT|nr:tryptophan--tRNA ligase [Anoxynatronum buryatiense]SMP61161.1 tryptophanyl-tRNA synthetase [Anoxynatronum buryatiense]
MDKQQKVIFSGAQPTGSLTLGNYIGAIQNWKELEKDYQCYYSIVDLHSLTVKQDPQAFRQANLSFLAQYLAAGLDPEKNVLFFQSHVREHTELAWVLSCYTYMGELNRMTQFKDKSEKHKDNINVGLYTYPVLMAADILLYQTDLVPVGDDQRQHLELCRDIAMRFNNVYGDTFRIPEAHIGKIGARIMSLQEPDKKMSKTDENQNGVIHMLDPADIILKKLKKAVTDSENLVKYRPEQPGIQNLMTIHATLSGWTLEQVEAHYEGKGYGVFKNDVAELITGKTEPFREKYAAYLADEALLKKVYSSGADRARERAAVTVATVKLRLGLV